MARAMNGRVYLVTGAGSGIGAAICRRLAAPGVSILVHTGSNRIRGDAVASECEAKGARCRVELGDLADPNTAVGLVAACEARFGGLDGLVSNAGFGDRRKLGEIDEAGFERSLGVILKALFRLATAAEPLLSKSGAGRVVAVSSFLAHEFKLGGDVFPASAAAKSGLEGLARSLAAQLAPKRITVNCVVPGYVKKDAATHSSLDPARWQSALERIPLRRLGLPDEIAAAVAFLLGADAGYITGQLLHVDGGLTL
ncbi:MAG TPA: SDR family oxidoreductase [Candidatus Cybelea sp.]|nr:SDR family oxidoreductase [Candidatus Cybelea sp.]